MFSKSMQKLYFWRETYEISENEKYDSKKLLILILELNTPWKTQCIWDVNLKADDPRSLSKLTIICIYILCRYLYVGGSGT